MHFLHCSEVLIVDECLHSLRHTADSEELTIVLAHLLMNEIRHGSLFLVALPQYVKHLLRYTVCPKELFKVEREHGNLLFIAYGVGRYGFIVDTQQ